MGVGKKRISCMTRTRPFGALRLLCLGRKRSENTCNSDSLQFVTDEPSKTRPITVFISYSWDDAEHKEWALSLASRLRADGVDAILDQTHLHLGERSPEFMERSVRKSDRVLVVCTETYKKRFDDREGGVGYEGHIITGEIIREVGTDKFIPVLRSGDWDSAIPTALSGVHGADLRTDSPSEYQRIVEDLHGVSHITPVGPPPTWLARSPRADSRTILATPAPDSDLQKFLEQRKRPRPETEIQKKILSKPRWQIWIHPIQFRAARFQSAEQCRQFILSSYVHIQGWFSYPWVSAELVEVGDEWAAGENDHSEPHRLSRTESWYLYRSAQFVHNLTFDEIPQLGDRVHVFEILDTVTAAFELAARMANRGVLSPEAAIRFDLYGVDGRQLTWPQPPLGDLDHVSPNAWSQDRIISVESQVGADDLKARRRELALEATVEIYSDFGWSDPPIGRLKAEQLKRFGSGQ